MSKLGYIYNSYGTQFNIAIANTYGFNVLNGNNLPVNSLIISSPIDENNNDIGSYSLIATDSENEPVRLTYTIKQGNGLNYINDNLEISIDGNTIIENNDELSVNLKSLIDNKTIKYKNSLLTVDYNNLTKLSNISKGLFKIDDKTVKSDGNGKIFIDTNNLLKVNENISYGICIGDGNKIIADQGKLSLNQNNLVKASTDNFGLIKSDNDQVNIENGIISINTENIDICIDNQYGIIKPDNNTIKLNANNELYIETQNLSKASDYEAGVFKYDSNVFEITNDYLTVKDNNEFYNTINELDNKISDIENKISEINYLLTEYEFGIEKPSILDFHCACLLTSVLDKPYALNEQVEDMEYQFITADFIISTNCPFVINVKFEDNIDPAVLLYEINYNDTHIYNGNLGLIEIYQTTEEEKIPIKLTFIAKNYYKDDQKEYSTTTKVKVTVSYANDVSINKYLIFNLIRFNSAYNEEIVYIERNI